MNSYVALFILIVCTGIALWIIWTIWRSEPVMEVEQESSEEIKKMIRDLERGYKR